VIYNALFGTLLVASLAGSRAPDLRKILYGVVLISLVAFVAFRDGIGCDWETYRQHFERFDQYSSVSDALEQSESGYWLLLIALNDLGFQYPALNVVAACVFFAGLHALASRQPDPLSYLALCFPVLIVNVAMSATRQEIAVGILCFAFNTFADKKIIWFNFLVLLAFLFHKSAILFFSMGFFLLPYPSVGALPAAAIVYFLSRSDIASEYAGVYVGTGYDAAGAVYRLSPIFLTGAAFLILFRKRWRTQFPSDYILVFLGSISMIAVMGLEYYSSVMGDRFGYYLVPIEIIIWCKAPYLFRSRLRLTILVIPITISILQLLVWTNYSNIFELCYTNYKMLSPL
jgi:hypothetical protein